MAEFTLLKLQLDDASFTANAPFSGSEDAGVEPNGGTGVEIEDESEDEGGPGLLPLVVGLVFLVVLAVAVRKFRGGSDEDSVTVASDEEPVAVAE